jgi:tetratricopeptide (TPR) repeat protein
LRAEEANPRLPGLHLRIGNAYLRMWRWEDAERAFEKALAIDGDSAYAYLGLAAVRPRQRRSREAAEQALVAVGLQHFLPLGHYCLGVALARLRRLDRAVLAFETALTMAPGLLNAHRWIATIEGMPGDNTEKATYHRRQAQELAKQRQRAARR